MKNKAISHKLLAISEEGQVIIVVILTLLIVSLIVLAVSSRSIVDIKISEIGEESARAFSAAEAGVEEAVEKIRSQTVVLGQASTIPLPNDTTATYTVAEQGGTQAAFLSPAPIANDLQTLQVYLANVNDLSTGNYTQGTICLLWGNQGTGAGASDTPAVEATLVYKNTAGNPATKRFAIDPNGRANLTIPSAGSCPTTISASQNNLDIDRTFAFAHQLSFGLTDASVCSGVPCVQLLRLRLLYNTTTSHYVGVLPQGGAVLPSQGYKISSTGTTTGGTTRKVEVLQNYPALPTIFDFALYNYSGAVTK